MRNRMILLLSALSLVAATGCTGMCKQGAEPTVSVTGDVQEGSNRVERSKSVVVTAVVEDIDVDQRLVTLRGPSGESTTLEVDESVRNLAQVRRGDSVRVEYFESIAFHVAEPGTVTVGDAAMAEGVERARPGERPGGVSARAITIVTRVEAIDKVLGTVTLKGPKGRIETVKAQNPANLDKIEVGDKIEITYTQAVAISVTKP